MLHFPLTQRSAGTEVLDAAAPDPRLAAREFGFLRHLNRATAASQALVATVERRLSPARGATVGMIDFGCGAADIATAAAVDAARRGWRLDILATDHAEVALDAARAHVARWGERRAGRAPDADMPPIRFARRDLLAGTSDDDPRAQVAHASLVLHHFVDEGVCAALRTMAGAATELVVWNDLIRSPLGEAVARLVTVGQAAHLRHDALLSVRRGFTIPEARAFAEAAGLEEIEIRRWRGARFVLSGRPTNAGRNAGRPRPRIRAAGLRFSFGSRCVVDDRSFTLRAGEIGLLSGPNGCGKTTSLRLLAGVLRPDAGSAWCDTSDGPVGFLPQRGGVISALAADVNAGLMQRIARVAPASRERRAREAFERMGVTGYARTPLTRVSIGQARRAAIATVLALAGGVLLLDEPDAGLDADGRERLARAMVDHVAGGGTALIASHEPAWLVRACEERGVAINREVMR